MIRIAAPASLEPSTLRAMPTKPESPQKRFPALPGWAHIDVRMVHNSGKNRSSSALLRYDTPLVPPVPRL
jgi:hypothetical protein